MSIYYNGACRTCKERINLAGFATSSVKSMFAEWIYDKHQFHDVVLVNDASSGWDEDRDEICNVIYKYKEVSIEE